jgi:uncharacterized protein (DUF2147 family)
MLKIALATVAFVVHAAAFAQATPVGLWKTIDDETKKEKSLVRVVESGGVLSGTVEKLLDPSRQDAKCEKCEGDLKDKPVLGLNIVRGVKKNADDETLWDGGTILDPNNGKLYKVRMTPVDGGKKLDVRGYVGMPMLGRTQTWVRVE